MPQEEGQVLRYSVPPDKDGIRLFSLLRSLGVSRTLMRRLKANQGFYIGETCVQSYQTVAAGDEIRLVIPEKPSTVFPEDIPLEILYEDEDVIVLNKPAGLVVHPTKGTYQGTLANGLAKYFQEKGDPSPIQPIHRLDKNTSGVLVFGKNPVASRVLGESLKEHKLQREYVAIAQGHLPQDSGTIDSPIARDPDENNLRHIDPEGQCAVTHYEVIQRLKTATYLKLNLETGRTHQIRIHLASIGHPLLGDLRYGGPDLGTGRHLLHAKTLAFHHPRSGDWMEFDAPLPEAMAEFLTE